jgi:hypothetical protein
VVFLSSFPDAVARLELSILLREGGDVIDDEKWVVVSSSLLLLSVLLLLLGVDCESVFFFEN